MFCMAQGTYTRTAAPIHIGALIRETCREIDMSCKEAALTQEIDPATWTRALNGDAPIDFWHLVLMPMRFWRPFLGKLASALIVSWFDERVNDRRSA